MRSAPAWGYLPSPPPPPPRGANQHLSHERQVQRWLCGQRGRCQPVPTKM